MEKSVAGRWWWGVSLATDRPSGWVRVRENAIQGTQLYIRDDLGVNRRKGFRFAAAKRVNARAAWMLSLASYDLQGSTTIVQPVYFNGAALAPGNLRTATTYPHYLQIDASYWRRFATFGRRGGTQGGRNRSTNTEVSLGVGARLGPYRGLSLSAFEGDFAQNEQSHEDGNVIHVRDAGYVFRIERPFGHRKSDYGAPPMPWPPG